MLGLRPIPRRMLPLSMEVYDGCRLLGRVGHVRLDASSSLVSDAYGEYERRKGTLVVDNLHSDGCFELPLGCFVVICGVRYQVTGRECLEAMNGNVHHWEDAVESVREEAE